MSLESGCLSYLGGFFGPFVDILISEQALNVSWAPQPTAWDPSRQPPQELAV